MAALVAVLTAGAVVAEPHPPPPPRPAGLGERPATTPAPSAARPSPDAASAPASSCLRMLVAAGHRVRAASPLPDQQGCVVEEPVIVEAIVLPGSGAERVIGLDPAPTLGCATAATLIRWLDTSVQPLARGNMAADLVSLRVGGGHECRNRNRGSGGKRSEHATGKALDIFGFTLGGAGGASTSVSVEKPSGMEQKRFLEAVRASACGYFSTVLGPGSDAFHGDHIHLDTQDRRSASSRYCG